MSRVLQVLAERYRASRAGRTGSGARDLVLPLPKLLREAGCPHGPEKEEAILELRRMAARDFLQLKSHSRDASLLLEVRLPLARAEEFVAAIGQEAPGARRAAFADALRLHAAANLPDRFRTPWRAFCERAAEAVCQGDAVRGLDPDEPANGLELLDLAAKLLAWEGESYLRFASAMLCGDSKRLGHLQARLEPLLCAATGGTIRSLADLGITESGGGCWIHGPATLRTRRGSLDLRAAELPVHLSKSDLLLGALESRAARWLLVENETMLLELAKLDSGALLLSSGFRGGAANSAVIRLVRSAPPETGLWHFGDSDPKGFDILRDLRQRSGRTIRSLHMRYRPADSAPPLSAEDRRVIDRLLDADAITAAEKADLARMLEANSRGRFEQESLGAPAPLWPFYPLDR
jgi:hypothetical protein